MRNSPSSGACRCRADRVARLQVARRPAHAAPAGMPNPACGRVDGRMLRYDFRLVDAANKAVNPIISIRNLGKTYGSGFQALKSIDLDIRKGEILALLGPNGAGKTTLISIVCGIVNASHGTVTVAGHDIVRDYRDARSRIGLVPQELSTDAFESVWATVKFSRGLFGRPPDPGHLEKVLR